MEQDNYYLEIKLSITEIEKEIWDCMLHNKR